MGKNILKLLNDSTLYFNDITKHTSNIVDGEVSTIQLLLHIKYY